MGQDDALIALVRAADAHITRTGPDTDAWLDRLDEQRDALNQMVERQLSTRPVLALEMAALLWRFWWMRGHMAEGRDLLERACRVDGPQRPTALLGLGAIAFGQGALEAAAGAFQERLDLVAADGGPEEMAGAYSDLARVALRRGDFAEVRRYAELGFAAAGEVLEAVRMPLHLRAAAARMEGRYDEARELYLESRRLNERLGNLLMVAAEDHNLAHVELHSGNLAEAKARFKSSRDWIFSHDNAYLRPYALLDAGVLALHEGSFGRATQLVAAAQQIFDATGSIPDPDDAVELDAAVARLKSELSDAFQASWDAGLRLTFPEARALALQDS